MRRLLPADKPDKRTYSVARSTDCTRANFKLCPMLQLLNTLLSYCCRLFYCQTGRAPFRASTNQFSIDCLFDSLARPGRSRYGRSFSLAPGEKTGQIGSDRALTMKKNGSNILGLTPVTVLSVSVSLSTFGFALRARCCRRRPSSTTSSTCATSAVSGRV